MPSSGMWLHKALVRSDVPEERITSIIRVEKISKLGTTLAVTRNWSITVINNWSTLATEAHYEETLTIWELVLALVRNSISLQCASIASYC
jgi:hypothetical protein